MASRPPNAFAGPVSNAMAAQAAPANNPYIDELIRKAQAAYPFIKQYNPLVSVGQGEGYAGDCITLKFQ